MPPLSLGLRWGIKPLQQSRSASDRKRKQTAKRLRGSLGHLLNLALRLPRLTWLPWLQQLLLHCMQLSTNLMHSTLRGTRTLLRRSPESGWQQAAWLQEGADKAPCELAASPPVPDLHSNPLFISRSDWIQVIGPCYAAALSSRSPLRGKGDPRILPQAITLSVFKNQACTAMWFARLNTHSLGMSYLPLNLQSNTLPARKNQACTAMWFARLNTPSARKKPISILFE